LKCELNILLSTYVGVESSDGVTRVFRGVDRKGLASTCKKLHPFTLVVALISGREGGCRMRMVRGVPQVQEWGSEEFQDEERQEERE